MRPLKWIDIPPLWLALFCVFAWLQASYLPLGLHFGGVWSDFLGGILVGGGLILMLLAIHEMRQKRTTVIPHRDADVLVQTGIFKRSRNPIYLGDALVLTGLILNWNSVLSLPLIPIFIWVIERRFVVPEETRLRRKFGAEFVRYQQRVRRWV